MSSSELAPDEKSDVDEHDDDAAGEQQQCDSRDGTLFLTEVDHPDPPPNQSPVARLKSTFASPNQESSAEGTLAIGRRRRHGKFLQPA